VDSGNCRQQTERPHTPTEDTNRERAIFGTLSVLLLSAAAPAASAGEVAVTASETTAPGISPFASVNHAQRGELDAVPGFAQFDFRVEIGRIDAEDVVRAGIAEGHPSANVLARL